MLLDRIQRLEVQIGGRRWRPLPGQLHNESDVVAFGSSYGRKSELLTPRCRIDWQAQGE